MRDYYKDSRRYQRRRHRRIGLLFLLIFLLIIIFGQSLLGLLVSLAIIIMLLALIAAVSLFISRMWNSRHRQHVSNQQATELFYTLPEAWTPYEQGYRAQDSSAQQTKEATEPEAPSLLSPGTAYEEQPQAQYEQELPPMRR